LVSFARQVMRLMPDGNLDQLLANVRSGQMNCNAVRRVGFARDIFAGLAYLHSPSAEKPIVVHRDVPLPRAGCLRGRDAVWPGVA